MHKRVTDRMNVQDDKIRSAEEKQRSIDRKITASLVFTIMTLLGIVVAIVTRVLV